MQHIKKNHIFFYNIFFIFIFSLCNADEESHRTNWSKLVPEYAYSFIPDDGVSDEMWEDETFLNKVEEAGLKFNKKILGKKISIDGFMVPLDFDYGEALEVNEFVLVPDAGMCIHVPPPPPNQMILVKLQKPERVRYMFQPILVEGVIKNTPPIKEVYNSIYEMKVTKIVDIDFDDLTDY